MRLRTDKAAKTTSRGSLREILTDHVTREAPDNNVFAEFGDF
jgi:hypothetical protein